MPLERKFNHFLKLALKMIREAIYITYLKNVSNADNEKHKFSQHL